MTRNTIMMRSPRVFNGLTTVMTTLMGWMDGDLGLGTDC